MDRPPITAPGWRVKLSEGQFLEAVANIHHTIIEKDKALRDVKHHADESVQRIHALNEQLAHKDALHKITLDNHQELARNTANYQARFKKYRDEINPSRWARFVLLLDWYGRDRFYEHDDGLPGPTHREQATSTPLEWLDQTGGQPSMLPPGQWLSDGGGSTPRERRPPPPPPPPETGSQHDESSSSHGAKRVQFNTPLETLPPGLSSSSLAPPVVPSIPSGV